jgi:hypothetical protein
MKIVNAFPPFFSSDFASPPFLRSSVSLSTLFRSELRPPFASTLSRRIILSASDQQMKGNRSFRPVRFSRSVISARRQDHRKRI